MGTEDTSKNPARVINLDAVRQDAKIKATTPFGPLGSGTFKHQGGTLPVPPEESNEG
jgi:hypothetical protein